MKYGGQRRHSVPAQRNAVVPKILVLHGDADRVSPEESVIDFQKEMRLAPGELADQYLQ